LTPAVAHFYWERLRGARRVLDVGCGSGALGALKPADAEVHGLEISPVLVAGLTGYASGRVWDLNEDEPFPFSDGYFDAVVAKDILEHLQRPWRTVAEIHRVLRPGGLAMASVVSFRNRRVWSDYTHVRGFTRATAKQLFVDAGFKVPAVWRMGGVPASARLHAIHLVPTLLAIPLFDWIWTSSYELLAHKSRE
jgi:SAM-dependent methyltransferase